MNITVHFRKRAGEVEFGLWCFLTLDLKALAEYFSEPLLNWIRLVNTAGVTRSQSHAPNKLDPGNELSCCGVFINMGGQFKVKDINM